MGSDWQSVALAMLGIICTLLGWWGNVVWRAVKDMRDEHVRVVESLRADHAALELHLSEHYVRKDDLRERLQEVFAPFKESLDEIKTWIRSQNK